LRIGKMMERAMAQPASIWGRAALAAAALLALTPAGAGAQTRSIPLDQLDKLTLLKATAAVDTFKGRQALRIEGGNDENVLGRLAILPDSELRDGTIEVDVAGEPGPGSFSEARGYVGVAFHVAPAGAQFECLYIRPTNGRTQDQVRRNHVTQYTSYPDWTWQRLRKDDNGRYESYADVVTGEWTHLKIEIENGKARFYVGGANQPTLLVNDLKMGAQAHGPVAFWVGLGTVAHFANLKITPR
jgi:hypothetical protein